MELFKPKPEPSWISVKAKTPAGRLVGLDVQLNATLPDVIRFLVASGDIFGAEQDWKVCFPSPGNFKSEALTLHELGIGGGDWLYIEPRGGLLGGGGVGDKHGRPGEVEDEGAGAYSWFEKIQEHMPSWVSTFTEKGGIVQATYTPKCSCGKASNEKCRVTSTRTVDQAAFEVLQKVRDLSFVLLIFCFLFFSHIAA